MSKRDRWERRNTVRQIWAFVLFSFATGYFMLEFEGGGIIWSVGVMTMIVVSIALPIIRNYNQHKENEND